MRAVVTRVTEASVEADGEIAGQIGSGLLVLLGIAKTDTSEQAVKLAGKVCNLRIFADSNGKTNLDLSAIGGQILVISQFTLYADCKSRRPGFTEAAGPDIAIPLYEEFIRHCKNAGFTVQTGVFGASMKVSSVNDGPFTVIVEQN